MKINDFKENNENKKEVMEKKMEALKLSLVVKDTKYKKTRDL